MSLIHFVSKLVSSALTLLVGCQEGHPARKNLTDEVLAWILLEHSAYSLHMV